METSASVQARPSSRWSCRFAISAASSDVLGSASRKRAKRSRSAGSPPSGGARDVFVYFDNDAKVHAPFDAVRLAERLGA